MLESALLCSTNVSTTATVALPTRPCFNCTLRLVRQAMEWGSGYQFQSCADIDIVVADGMSLCFVCSQLCV